ncbi:MAG: hypothetical protein A2580_12535 [Hydrogenophilales bacterium RIFOXYD1_FULL_62_11]|nr:MAG: hypothetical protein A2580_12535 [Hydrogenophilales bacterium RIFOXYD1_FULL_62_11]
MDELDPGASDHGRIDTNLHPVRSKWTNSLMQKPLFMKQPVINPGIRIDEAGDGFFECGATVLTRYCTPSG